MELPNGLTELEMSELPNYHNLTEAARSDILDILFIQAAYAYMNQAFSDVELFLESRFGHAVEMYATHYVSPILCEEDYDKIIHNDVYIEYKDEDVSVQDDSETLRYSKIVKKLLESIPGHTQKLNQDFLAMLPALREEMKKRNIEVKI